MSKQDKTYSRTASDIERKYNLGLLAQGGFGGDSERLSKVVQELTEYKNQVNKQLNDIEDSIEESQQDLGSHSGNASIHVTEAEKSNIETAYIHSRLTSGNPHNVTKSQIGLGSVDNTADISKPVSTAQQSAIDKAHANANAYTDEKIAGLINGAPTTLDTLKEIADAMAENKDVVQALEESIGAKANQAELDAHTENSTIHITASERTQLKTAHSHSLRVSGNPHGVTKSDVGLGNVDNTADAEKKVLSATKATQDGNGNVIADTYATKDELINSGGVEIRYDADNETLTIVCGSDSATG